MRCRAGVSIRVPFFLVVLAAGCANDPQGDVSRPDAASQDAAIAADRSVVDGAVDGSVEPPDVSEEIDAIQPPGEDAAREPQMDVGTAEGTLADASDEADAIADVTRQSDAIVDASRDADATTDRCLASSVLADPWTSVAALYADASDDVDARDGADGYGGDVRDGGDVRLSDATKDGDIVVLCDALQSDWRTFVVQNRDCTVAADCIVVGGAGSCECSPSWDPRLGHPIGEGSGDAINASSRATAQTYLNQWNDLDCNLLLRYCIFDAGPPRNLRCELGTCRVDPGGCNLPPQPEPCR